MMNYLSMMSNCFKADILFLEGKGSGVGGVGVHVWGGGNLCEEVCLLCNAGSLALEVAG